MKRYDKEVLLLETVIISDIQYECFIVLNEDGQYFNIHITSPFFNDDEMNTLHLQEPFEHKPTRLQLIAYMYEHYIWYKHSTNDSVLSISVTIKEG